MSGATYARCPIELEFSAQTVFYMPTYIRIFFLLSCVSHTLYGQALLSRGSNFQILNWTLGSDKLIFPPELKSESYGSCTY